MEGKQKVILDEFATDLKSSLNLTYLLPHLMKRKLLTTKEEHRLKNEAKTDHDNNCEFIDYLKTKGSRAFDLFLAALRDETEHLGHVDLYKRMSERAEIESAGISTLTSSDALNIGQSAKIYPDQSVNHFCEPCTVESLPIASLRSLSIPSATVTNSGAESAVIQQLNKIEKIVTNNQTELQELRKVCDKLIFVKLEQESKPAGGSRPQGTSAECSSLDSDIPVGPVQQAQSCENQATKRPLLGHHHDTNSLHSTCEEETSNTSSALAIPHKSPSLPQKSWPIGLHV